MRICPQRTVARAMAGQRGRAREHRRPRQEARAGTGPGRPASLPGGCAAGRKGGDDRAQHRRQGIADPARGHRLRRTTRTRRSTDDMQHLTLKAATVEAEEELGVFETIVSAWIEDRMKDVILPGAFDKTIAAWQRSGKRLPLLFEHSTKAVGEIDPHSMTTDAEGLRVRRHVDRSTDEGEQVWRQVKASTASFSIGGAFESRRRKGGKGKEIYEVDLLEISATSTPAHSSARVL